MAKYILEIKNRLVLLFIAWFSTVLICYLYKETLLFVITQPYTATDFKKPMNPSYFIFTDVTEILSIYLKLMLFFSFQIFCIYIVYHFFLFASPAFFYVEYSFFGFGVKAMLLIWIISAALSTYFLIPFTWHFFLSFQDFTLTHSFSLYFEAKLKEYLYFYMSSYFLYLFYFQFFTLFVLFLNSTKLSSKKIKKSRKFNYYGFVVLSTIISPPEILSQLCIGLIIIFLYELSLLLFLLKNNC
jgi:sec-independent protein translocase protein TatC